MAKPKAIRWLEQETGQSIDYPAESPPVQERHLSVRLSGLAAERNLSISQLVRELLSDAVAQRRTVASLDARALADRLTADVAEVKRRLAG